MRTKGKRLTAIERAKLTLDLTEKFGSRECINPNEVINWIKEKITDKVLPKHLDGTIVLLVSETPVISVYKNLVKGTLQRNKKLLAQLV